MTFFSIGSTFTPCAAIHRTALSDLTLLPIELEGDDADVIGHRGSADVRHDAELVADPVDDRLFHCSWL